jgi:flagellar protein FlaF
MSIDAYRRRKEAAETPRELERRAFTTAIGKLIEGKEKGGRALIEACYLNHQLWTTLAVDLALPDNALSEELKARLISISIWVQRYTPQVMHGAASPDPLISVNRSILEGLSTPPAGQATSPEAAIPQLGTV